MHHNITNYRYKSRKTSSANPVKGSDPFKKDENLFPFYPHETIGYKDISAPGIEDKDIPAPNYGQYVLIAYLCEPKKAWVEQIQEKYHSKTGTGIKFIQCSRTLQGTCLPVDHHGIGRKQCEPADP